MSSPILEITDLSVRFRTAGGGAVHAVSGVSFTIMPGESVCLVGESGSGKSVSAMAILGLLPRRNTIIEATRMAFDGQSIIGLSERAYRSYRGKAIGMIFQDPMTSLNPAHTIGMQIIEGIRLHEGINHRSARARALEMLDMVRIPDASTRLDAYPHELSGGMRQRAMIAMALSCRPRLLIADEPTTALDVTIQAQILTLIEDLRSELGLSLLMITHDLGVVADIADRVVVLYGGQVMETAGVETLFDAPAHPYTVGLMNAMPALAEEESGRLRVIPGAVQRITEPLKGCAFAPRCTFSDPACRTTDLRLLPLDTGHESSCLRTGEIELEPPRALKEAAQ